MAKRFGEAYPLGNGQIGALVYGSYPVERIAITENTFFSGKRNSCANKKTAPHSFEKMRKLEACGDYTGLHKEAEKFIGNEGNYGTNLPVGEIHIAMSKEIKSVKRMLNIQEGVATCCFETQDEQQINETVFVSHPDHALVLQLESKQDFDVMICWKDNNTYGTVDYRFQDTEFRCNAYERMHCDELCGVTLDGKIWIDTDGIKTADKKGIFIKKAKGLNLYLALKTDFCERAGISETEKNTAEKLIKPNTDIEEIYQKHCADVKENMDRINFSLSGFPEAEALVFMFQYGRYLLLCSSRKDSILPAHLQGIWNDNVACNIGWTCDMHLDINTQMNYWLSNACRMEECTVPLEKWITDILVPQGRNTAEKSYGIKGWVAELVSNAFGYAAPYWATPLAPCPTGGVWTIMQMWENYRFTENKEYLEHIFLIFQEAVLFFADYVFKDEEGEYSCGPSISPENSFSIDGKLFQISSGCTYEILMIRELFTVYMEMLNILQRPLQPIGQKVITILANLKKYRICEDGTIAEYAHDFKIPDKQHRHTSHLLGLFPFSQINPIDTPILCEAAKKTIEAKLNPADGWEDTGWARSLLALYEARLWDGDKAYEHLQALLNRLLEPNGMIYHPPTRGAMAFDHVYELDGNTGFTMAMTEMLLQSHLNFIHILPALPDEWCNGTVEGICARGNILINIRWKNHLVETVEFLAQKDKRITVKYKNDIFMVDLEGGKKKIVRF
jgi:alpha-L-fucosidase 2